MIDFQTIKCGDKVKVVRMGAPGFAQLDDVLEVTQVRHDRVYAKKANGEEAFFELGCGASRLEIVEGEMDGSNVYYIGR